MSASGIQLYLLNILITKKIYWKDWEMFDRFGRSRYYYYKIFTKHMLLKIENGRYRHQKKRGELTITLRSLGCHEY